MRDKNNRSDEWSTPTDLFDMLNEEFHFTLDAAATHENAKCTRYCTKDHSGLSYDWDGETVWCNPPYSDIAPWVAKAYKEMTLHRVCTVMLLPVRTGRDWFQQYIQDEPGVGIRFIRGRLRFNESTQNAPFDSMIVIFGGKKR